MPGRTRTAIRAAASTNAPKSLRIASRVTQIRSSIRRPGTRAPSASLKGPGKYSPRSRPRQAARRATNPSSSGSKPYVRCRLNQPVLTSVPGAHLMLKFASAGRGLQFLSARHAVAAGLAGVVSASIVFFPARGADSPIPALMLPFDQGWTGFITSTVDPATFLPDDYLHGPANMDRAMSLGAPPDKVAVYLTDRTFNEYIPPESGIGPITDGPEYPFYNNAVAGVLRKNPSYRVAELTSEAAKNLMPWAVEALKKQNALALAGKNGETRQARCWETGVPNIHEAPQMLYFIQTPREVVMYQGHRTRHVYLNVGHSKNPVPSWYGESVGHY